MALRTKRVRAFSPVRPATWQAAQKVAAAVVELHGVDPLDWDDAQHLGALSDALGGRCGEAEWADFCQARHEAALAAGGVDYRLAEARRVSLMGKPTGPAPVGAWGVLARALADDGEDERDADGYLVAARKAVA